MVGIQSCCIQGMYFLRKIKSNEDLLLTSEKRKLDQTYQFIQCQKAIKIYGHGEISSGFCDHLEGWGREDGRETQEGGDMGIYVYV